jgi:DUF1680 family protein
MCPSKPTTMPTKTPTSISRHRIASCLLAALAFCAVARGDESRTKVQPFDLRDVRITGGPFKAAMDLNARYLLSLEPDRFLHFFHAEAGLPPKAPPYGGWESPTTGAGRCLGHYLSALSLQYRAGGDERFKQRVDYIVSELAACQEANGGGYLSAQARGKEFWADLAAGNPDALKKHRVPWYITHKLFAGLRDAHQLAGSERARQVLVRLADWAIAVTAKLDDAGFQRMLEQEYGGMREVLADVYAITGERKYLDLANRFQQPKFTDPLAAGQDNLDHLHANTQVPKVIACARVYELTGEPRDRRAAEYFWDEVISRHTYAIGGNSNGEHLHAPGKLSDQLGVAAAETCNTYNMLKLTRALFTFEPRVAYADYYERALYNHILASQDPEQGMFAYYVSLKPGHFKTFSTPHDSFWCCVGTGMENHTKYADSIYFHDANSLYVNLFVPSELTWKEKGLVVRQEGGYPADGSVRLTLSCAKPVTLALRIRHPAWAGPELTIAVNDRPVPIETKPGSYATVEREWKDGDTVSIRVPLSLRTEPTPDDPRKVAIFYGPLVLGGRLGTEGLHDPMPYARGQLDYAKVPGIAVPRLATGGWPVDEWLKPVEGEPLTFRTLGVAKPADVVLIPFYRQHRERYTVYWDLDP